VDTNSKRLFDKQEPFVRRAFELLDKFKFPAECAFDTVTIARKR
jgi:hypothetical protein